MNLTRGGQEMQSNSPGSEDPLSRSFQVYYEYENDCFKRRPERNPRGGTKNSRQGLRENDDQHTHEAYHQQGVTRVYVKNRYYLRWEVRHPRRKYTEGTLERGIS